MCADAFFQWANDGAVEAPLKRAYAIFLQAMDRFINEEHQASLQLLLLGVKMAIIFSLSPINRGIERHS